MAFKSQTECPMCGGQLKLTYDKIMMVQCQSCDRSFTVDEISNYYNNIRHVNLDEDDGIYSKEKYDEALTTKSIENLKDEALTKRMKLALITESYEELRKYIEELRRREPDNYLVYEYSLMAKYHVFNIEELENVNLPFYENENYRILYRVSDQFKRQQLDEITKRAKDRQNQKKQIVAAKAKKEEEKGKAIRFVALLVVVLPFVMAIIGAIMLFSCTTQLSFIGNFAGVVTGWVFYTLASLIILIPSLIITVKSKELVTVTKVFMGISGAFAAIGIIIVATTAPKAEPSFNPAEQVTMRVTSVSDSSGYSTYNTTLYMVIENHSKYSFEEFGNSLSILKNGRTIGSWTCVFRGDFAANSSVSTSIELRSNSSDVYNATFDEMTFKYRLSYLSRTSYGTQVKFNCSEKTAYHG